MKLFAKKAQTETMSLSEMQQNALDAAKKLEEYLKAVPYGTPGRTPLVVAASSLRNFVAETL